MLEFSQSMEYNTQLPPLRLSAYGRNIQNMIDYCLSIPDREERTVCAYNIARIMAAFFPEATNNGDPRKIWDHINIMADYQLDVDFPFEVATREEAHQRPEKLEYDKEKLRSRIYGKHLQEMIATVAEMPESPEREAMVMMLGNHMKKLLVVQNQEYVDDMRVLNDLIHFSDGKINPDANTFILHEYKADKKAPQGKKKKKK